MRRIIAIVSCFLIIVSICFAKEYPVSEETQKLLYLLCTEFNTYLEDLNKISLKVPPDSKLFESLSDLRVGISQINIWLGTLYKMLLMEFYHGEANQYNSQTIAVIKQHIVMVKENLDIVEEINSKLLPVEGDKFLIRQYKKWADYLSKAEEIVNRIEEELENSSDIEIKPQGQ